MKPSAAQFLNGELVEYIGSDRRHYIAQYRKPTRLAAASHLRVIHAGTGKVDMDLETGDATALAFFRGLERDNVIVDSDTEKQRA